MSNKAKGALFVNDRRETEKHPHWTGNMDVSNELLRELVEVAKSGQPVKLRLAAWKSQSQKGMEYISVNAELPQKQPEEMPF